MTDDRRPIVDPVTGEVIDGWYAHPAADLFPMAQEDELAGLAADIEQNGLVEAIWTIDSQVVLDGRNRLVACHRIGIQPPVRRYSGDDPVTFAVSQNLHRRHLTASQQAAVALELVPLYEDQADKGGRPRKDEKLGGDLHHLSKGKRAPRSTDKAAAAVGVSGSLVAKAARVEREAPELIDDIKAGTLTVNKAEKLVRKRKAAKQAVANAADTAGMFQSDAAERAREVAENPGDHELRALLGVLQNADDQINAINHQLVKTATDERAWKRHARLVADLETTINKLKETQQ